ncbi:MAG: Gldg family protein [Clostridia bacterium]|nr:Gldg family protein [Clostridia bacterium]
MLKFDKKTKIGVYTIVMTAVVLAVLVVVNILALNAPSKYTKLDVTSLDLYTLSDETMESVPKIQEKINIYYICSGGEDMSGSVVNNLPMLSTFLERYAELNSNISFEIVDPIADPTFTDNYASDGVDENSIIVESEKRFKVINFADLYYYSDGSSKIAAEEYQTYMYTYYYSYGTFPSLSLHFDGESKVTSALDYVTTDRIPVVYTLVGHGETTLSETLLANIESESMAVKSLNLLTSSIPDDAECIIINVPTSDINADEAKMIMEYLDKGGSIFLNTIYTGTDFTNLMGVLSDYGLSAEEGMVIEADSNMHYNNYPFYLLPEVNGTSFLASELSSKDYLFMPYSHGIISGGETDNNITVTPLFTTSDKAYTIAPDAEGIEKTENSAEGAFDIAVLAEDTGSGAKIIWCGSPAFEDSANSMTRANYRCFISMLNGIVERERVVYNIAATELSSSALVVNETQANLWGVIFVIIIPLSFAILGVARWYVRRRR